MSEPVTPPEPQVAIPESLRQQLDGFRRQLWRIKVIEAIVAGVIGLLVSFLMVYSLDRFWQTPGMVRLAILLGGTSLFTVFAPIWLHRWVWKHRREAQLARLIARRFPGLGDRLLGVIELQDQNEAADSLSPRLRAAAMAAVAVEAGRRKLDESLPPSRHRRWGVAAVVLAAVAGLTFVVTPRAGWNALQRWVLPLSDTERYTFTRIEGAPRFLAVPYGEAFEIKLKLSGDSEKQPWYGTGRYGLQPEVTAGLHGETYTFSFPGQQDQGVIVFRIGDARHETRIEPVQRPVAESITAIVTPPDYLGIPTRTLELSTGVLSAVEGSAIEFRLKTDRNLAKAEFGPTRPLQARVETPSPGLEAAPDAPLPMFEAESGELILEGRTARTPELRVGSLPFEIPFAWRDSHGLTGDSGFRIRVEAMRDAAPAVYLQGIDRQKVILPEETVDFEVFAEDDFGVKVAGVEWSGEFTKPSGETPASGEMKLADGGAEQRRLAGPVAFSPSAVGISPQKLTLRAYAEDFHPGRGRVYSEPVTLYVLTRDEHAQLLKSQFDRAITELEDLARRELNLYEDNQRLERLEAEELQTEENLKRLDAQEQAEAEGTRRMEELTERMEQLLKDAARNGEIEKETMKKMAESLKSMQELSKEDMPKVRGKLGEAAEQSNTPEKSAEDLAEAVEEQKKVVEKMQQAIEQANEANERFEAGTFVNRLKKAASEQDGITNSLKDAFFSLLGEEHARLDPADQRRLTDATRQQSDTASDVRWIQEDLAHYHARTQKETFKQILDAMRESRIDIGLEEVRARLQRNHSYEAAESSQEWGGKLAGWAKLLEGEMQENNMSGGGDGGGPSPEDEDFEFMLRVMKMVQQQQDLRSRTRALEQLRRSVEGPETRGGDEQEQPEPDDEP